MKIGNRNIYRLLHGEGRERLLEQLDRPVLDGMDPEQAESFARDVDWTTTMVVPIPRYGVAYESVRVNGVTGALMVHERAGLYVLLWVEDGVVYALSGPGEGSGALEIAGSLE